MSSLRIRSTHEVNQCPCKGLLDLGSGKETTQGIRNCYRYLFISSYVCQTVIIRKAVESGCPNELKTVNMLFKFGTTV